MAMKTALNVRKKGKIIDFFMQIIYHYIRALRQRFYVLKFEKERG
jgi:hypothetical protein